MKAQAARRSRGGMRPQTRLGVIDVPGGARVVYLGPREFRVQARRSLEVAPLELQAIFSAAHAGRRLSDRRMALVAELTRRDPTLWGDTAALWLTDSCDEGGPSGIDWLATNDPAVEYLSDEHHRAADEYAQRRREAGWTFHIPSLWMTAAGSLTSRTPRSPICASRGRRTLPRVRARRPRRTRARTASRGDPDPAGDPDPSGACPSAGRDDHPRSASCRASRCAGRRA